MRIETEAPTITLNPANSLQFRSLIIEYTTATQSRYTIWGLIVASAKNKPARKGLSLVMKKRKPTIPKRTRDEIWPLSVLKNTGGKSKRNSGVINILFQAYLLFIIYHITAPDKKIRDKFMTSQISDAFANGKCSNG
jgi:hypothetical protein